MSKDSSDKFSALTEKYLQKRLAIIFKGNLISAPIIASKVKGHELAISFGTAQKYEEFKDLLMKKT